MSKPHSPETRAKIAEALRGKPKSAEHRAKISADKKSKPMHPNFAAAGRVAAIGREYSLEARLKMSAAVKRESLTDRFWPKVKVGSDDECWEWQAFRNPNGYGMIGVGSTVDGTKRVALAHRVAWELTNGPIPDDVKVRHLVCDNPPCCNPAHLALGTHADNAADKMAKGRHRASPGEANGSSKLTDEQRRIIRERYAAGGISQCQLASDFHVDQTTISRIVRVTNYHAPIV